MILLQEIGRLPRISEISKKQNMNNGKARQGAKYKLLTASFLRQTVMLFAYLKYDHQEISNAKRC